MSKTRLFSILGITILLLSFLSNPPKELHEKVVKDKIISLLKTEPGSKNKELIDFGIQLIGNTLVDQFVEEHLHIKNYYVFSLTKIRWEDQNVIIGLGIFGKVWLSPKIDEKAQELLTIVRGR
ncbi:hypothetical protein ORI89_03425 [Sphingobacterium sp. UT-1RO-CII-1]|uniref:hypothetical protein n=1 Tax=Sphingobacterium sp. UT-1RO-CII-1 TaxID=2995225 RepID=UPI00227C059A|nr:hypothetical protein [Sphingobacterium sp. UT-1RO-CII-1]MCY4778688.1 hypothetical protein [Sphingobacterium sp. UT-1RO-CII-1]